MTLNKEVFFRDPTSFTIPNDGVAQVLDPKSDAEWAVLRYELESFVCDGEYRKGLERILSTFLTNLGKPKQPAVWVSGFYGSGKSHLVRVLEYLWRDIGFPDGKRARAIPKLPSDITDLLKELTRESRHHGGLWSAAGTLGSAAGRNVRLSILGILFKSTGLPEKYPIAKFVIWLKQNGYYDSFRERVAQRGKDLNRELSNLYVSTAAECLLDVYPGFATNPAAARGLLKEQFPQREDISNDELADAMNDALLLSDSTNKLPLTLLIFDEMQQFLNEDQARTLAVQEVVEMCSARFGSRILFVATGQASLEGTPQLQKLKDRFTVSVMLSDTDVERVVREVVLRKKQDQVPELKAVLQAASGEIDRHLVGTRIGAVTADAADLVPDYPLLPTRRRFWERLLRAVDAAGTAGQLRTQLKIVHEATRAVANGPVGQVVAGDFIYGQRSADMLQSGVLLREIATIIQEQVDGTEDGDLRSRLCALIFLIGKLPTEGVVASGVKATASALADLLVEDLNVSSGELRQRIPAILNGLVEKGTLMLVGEEYRLQTREGAEWDGDYHRRESRLMADDARIASDRATALREIVNASLKGISLTQGNSKTPRKFDLFYGLDVPSANSGSVPVWVRDEWSVSEKTVREDAQAAGLDSPIVFVFLPKLDADALKATLARVAAAQACVDQRPTPTTPEGIEAKSAMESRIILGKNNLQGIVMGIIRNASVFQGGGNDVAEEGFSASVRKAIEAAVVRMFPKFSLADSPNWELVVKRARDGAADALTALGYQGDTDKHPTCQEIRSFVGGSGEKGNEIIKYFMGSPYGWPKDAIDGSLLALMAAGLVRASRNGQALSLKQITQGQTGVIDFYNEGVTVNAGQRLAIRKLLVDLGMAPKPGEESDVLSRALEGMAEMAMAAGGEPPLPARPSTAILDPLRLSGGNAQLVAAYERRETLLTDWNSWKRAQGLIAQRQPVWDTLNRLLVHADKLPVTAGVRPQVESIRVERALLTDPDPVPPLLDVLTNALRPALQSARQRLVDMRSREVGALEASAEWEKISPQERRRILSANSLDAVPAINVGTDEALLTTLDEYPLSKWEDLIAALPARVQRAREEAAQLVEPQAVRIKIPSATLKTRPEAQDYLDRLGKEIMKEIDAGRPVIL